jgi:hypothetical protein
MSKQDFNVKKGLNVRDGRFIANENEVSIDGTDIFTHVNDQDTILQSNIDAEETSRISADNTLQSNIDAEEAARIAADATLQSNIDTETGRIDDILDGTSRNIMVIDGNTPPYNGDYSLYANRLQIPLDVDEVHINTIITELSVNIEILDFILRMKTGLMLKHPTTKLMMQVSSILHTTHGLISNTYPLMMVNQRLIISTTKPTCLHIRIAKTMFGQGVQILVLVSEHHYYQSLIIKVCF